MQSYIGLDIHKKFLFAVVLNSKGDLLLEKKVRNEPWELDKFFKKIEKDSHMALESCSCWEYVFDYLTDMGFTNVVYVDGGMAALMKAGMHVQQFNLPAN